MAQDPVCRMHVEEKGDCTRMEYRGAVYYFCSEGCRACFELNPEKYLAQDAQSADEPRD